MPRFSANLSFLFLDRPFLDRFAAAAACGFKGVEFHFPYAFPMDEVADAARRAGVEHRSRMTQAQLQAAIEARSSG